MNLTAADLWALQWKTEDQSLEKVASQRDKPKRWKIYEWALRQKMVIKINDEEIKFGQSIVDLISTWSNKLILMMDLGDEALWGR
jgi:hypothetical protein